MVYWSGHLVTLRDAVCEWRWSEYAVINRLRTSLAVLVPTRTLPSAPVAGSRKGAKLQRQLLHPTVSCRLHCNNYLTHLQYPGFSKRENYAHRADGKKYATLETEAARQKFAKEHAARWSEFSRLPYFDLVRMIVIDPVHNLLLGTPLPLFN